MTLLADLVAATTTAHSSRALVRAIAAALVAHVPVIRVELFALGASCTAELVGDDWQCHEDVAGSSAAIMLAPNLAVVVRGALPDYVTGTEFQRALTQVITAAAEHAEVIQRVARLSQRAHTENRALRADLARLEHRTRIVARSVAMRAAIARAERVARHTSTVLLLGESGTGKEVLAHEIHRLSLRGHRSIVQINCGAIPEGLLDSELFGHERGAFTGADRKHVGAFERAHRGTLFLDEVAELPPGAQVKLLRVLQERQLRRVGGEVQIDVDVRLIAATNRSLAAMVEQGTFREDLYYRLDVFSIQLPPLRDRRGDLPLLAAQLVDELARKLGMSAPTISRSVLARLEAHDWPGNVRELMNVLETALILGDGKTLELPDELRRRSKPRTTEAGLKAMIRSTIEDALRTTHGKIYGTGGAAELLGLKPGTLQSKMVKLGIRRDGFI